MNKIVFFGLGSVARVMSQCFYDLYKNSEEQISFIFVCRDIKKAKNNLFRMEDVLDISTFLELKDFSILGDLPISNKELFKNTIGVINSSSPYFNDSILKFALAINSNYCDLSSNIYDEKSTINLQFCQYKFNSDFKNKDNFALINAGISPGITNFLIGEKVLSLKKQDRDLIKNINLYLLENISSSEILFSWSPKDSFAELEEKPRWIENGKSVTIQPFTSSKKYKFPHYNEDVEEYPIYQEEIISIHQTYPEIQNIKAYSGGSDVELIKNLFQLNLLSKGIPACAESQMSVEEIITNTIPKLNTPEELSTILRKDVIKSAKFAAVAEIEKENVVEVTGLSFNHYLDLIDTPYEGATYISYPAGIGAAVMFYYTHILWKDNKSNVNGIITGENLPLMMGGEITNMLKFELVKYGIDLISHSHSFKFCKGMCSSIRNSDL